LAPRPHYASFDRVKDRHPRRLMPQASIRPARSNGAAMARSQV
jgi:hypothetical protein